MPQRSCRMTRTGASVPGPGASPPRARDVLDPAGVEVLERFDTLMLGSDEQQGLLAEVAAPVRPFMDLRLRRDPVLYRALVFRLLLAGMINFNTSPSDVVIPFCMTKNGGRQRLVWTCQLVNWRFKASPPLAMANGASWSLLHVPPGAELHVAQSDLKDLCYDIGIDVALGACFSLPALAAAVLREWRVPASRCHGRAASGLAPQRVWPQLRVVPMGWNWARGWPSAPLSVWHCRARAWPALVS